MRASAAICSRLALPSMAQYKGADSTVLLAKVAADVRALGYHIINLDSTVIAQAPKLAPHIHAMRERIAFVLDLDIGCVNVKASPSSRFRASPMACARSA